MSSEKDQESSVFSILKLLEAEIKDESIAADLKEDLQDASAVLKAYYKSKADKLKEEGNEFLRQKKYKEAIECYTKAIEIDKENAIFYCNRAAAKYLLSDYASSIDDCKTAVEIDPKYAKAWDRLGLARMRLSKELMKETCQAFEEALKQNPSNGGYKHNLKLARSQLKALNVSKDDSNRHVPMVQEIFSFMNSPQYANFITQLMNDPQVRNSSSMENRLQASTQFFQRFLENNPDFFDD